MQISEYSGAPAEQPPLVLSVSLCCLDPLLLGHFRVSGRGSCLYCTSLSLQSVLCPSRGGLRTSAMSLLVLADEFEGDSVILCSQMSRWSVPRCKLVRSCCNLFATSMEVNQVYLEYNPSTFVERKIGFGAWSTGAGLCIGSSLIVRRLSDSGVIVNCLILV